MPNKPAQCNYTVDPTFNNRVKTQGFIQLPRRVTSEKSLRPTRVMTGSSSPDGYKTAARSGYR